ncbi:MAG: PAS domain-containing protein [Candidatus Peregrinibacteria bacterium]
MTEKLYYNPPSMAMLFPYFELAASLFILLLSFEIWTRHYENRAARFFARLAMVAFLASILEYSSRIAFTLDFAQHLDRLSASLWALLFSMFAHFTIIFCRKRPWPLFALYLPPAILAALFLFTNIMYTRFEIWSVGIVSQPSWWYGLFFLQTVFFGSVGLFNLYRHASGAVQPSVKKQALVIAVGSFFPLLIGLFTDEILPIVLGTRVTPPTAVFDIAIMMAFIFWAMRHYSLFAISPGMAAETIIETMPDALLVTNLDGQILFLNEEALKFFHVPKEKITGINIKVLFKQKEKFDQLQREAVEKGVEVERFQAELVNPAGEHIPTLINARLLRQRGFGELLGIVFVIRDVRG